MDEPISPARPADLPSIVSLLTSSGLPTSDLQADALPQFLITRRWDRVIGVIGLERFGDVGLLRSLAVQSEYRGRGLGVALTQALERQALQTGLTSVVLLTQTAEVFFRACGYQTIKRSEMPLAVQATQQFRILCPESAICMRKELTRACPKSTP